jgi:hypothetical protein
VSSGRNEGGQTVVEFAIILSILLLLTLGLVDVGRAFFQYNAVSAAARYGARWGAVVGGEGACQASTNTSSESDWCNQLGTYDLTSPANSGGFWSLNGNKPLQSIGTACPLSPSSNLSPSPYYTVSDFRAAKATSIIGAVAQHFDSSSTSTNVLKGSFTPGFDSSLKACIELPTTTIGSQTIWDAQQGDSVKVVVYYAFKPATPLFGSVTLPLVADSQFVIE